MKNKNIFVNVGYDGSCPQSIEAIKVKDDSTIVYPSWRRGGEGISEEAKGAGSRFDIEVVNKAKSSREITMTVDWEDIEKTRIKYHDYIFTKQEKDTDWGIVCGYTKAGVATFRLILKTGKTIICQNPRHNYSDYENFVRRVSKNSFVTKELAGKSEEDRNIWLLSLTDDSPIDRKEPIVIMAVNHAYESAGSYCVGGMVNYLLSEEQWAKYFMSRFIFYLLPMTNPDGVYNGLSRLTSPKGADLNRIVTVPDKAWDTIKSVLDEVKPRLFINIHNWIDKFKDGLLCLDGEFARKITSYMPDQIKYGKKWYIEDAEEYFRKHQSYAIPDTIKSWKDYCEEKFGSTALVLEFPWFGRNARIMRETGAKVLKAVLFAQMSR